jgi:alpha-L-fucosidase
LLLNLPPDRRGRIHERDEASLREFRRMLDATFADNLAARAVLRPSNVRGGSNHFGPRLLLDGERGTHWCTDDAVTRAELELEFDAATTFNVLDLREALHLGQRVHGWGFDAWREGAWVELARGESIGSRRLWRGDPVSARRIRLRLEGPVCPALAELGLYLEPEWVRRPPQAP